MTLRFTFLALLFPCSAHAAFFMDAAAMVDLLSDYDAYQERREIRYMAKASQYVGYVTGVVDALDGARFCLPGGVDAEQTAALVATYVRRHGGDLPRHASDAVVSALAERHPCPR